MSVEKNSGLTREGMDPNTSHGKAQAIFDEIVEVSSEYNIPITYGVEDKSLLGTTGTIFEAPLTPNTPKVPEKKKRGKILETNQTRHSTNLAGLTGFYKGIYYENGAPKKGRKG